MSIYQVAIRDYNHNVLEVIRADRFDQFRYSRVLNAWGLVQFTLPTVEVHPALLLKDTIIDVVRLDVNGDPMVDASYFSASFIHVPEDDRSMTIIGGVGLEHMLRRAVIRPDDDPNEAGGYSTKSGACDTVMCEIVDNHMITPNDDPARARPRLSTITPAGTGSTVYFREEFSSNKKVIESLAELAPKGRTDFWIEKDVDGNFIFHAGVMGIDRRRKTHYPSGKWRYFSTENQNIRDPELEINRTEEQNFVYVLGQGQPGQRIVWQQALNDQYDSPWNRCEFVITDDGANTIMRLETAAENALQEKRLKAELKFQPLLLHEYRSGWDLGDLVTAGVRGYELDYRIEGVTVEPSQDGESIELELSRYDF